MSGRTLRYILVGALALAIGIPSVAIGFGEGRTMLLGKRNPSPNASRALNAETEIIASNGTYGTRQSNKRDGDGGGAIYGCRSNPGAEPCVRANNLKGGRAFEFDTVGKEAGRIEIGDPTGAPLTTNATGVATGFNADKVDGRDASDLASPARHAVRRGQRRRLARPPAAPRRPPRRRPPPPQQTYTVTFVARREQVLVDGERRRQLGGLLAGRRARPGRQPGPRRPARRGRRQHQRPYVPPAGDLLS